MDVLTALHAPVAPTASPVFAFPSLAPAPPAHRVHVVVADAYVPIRAAVSATAVAGVPAEQHFLMDAPIGRLETHECALALRPPPACLACPAAGGWCPVGTWL